MTNPVRIRAGYSTEMENYMDTIFIEGLLVHTTIGMYDWEKQFEQPLIFDVEMTTDLAKSAQSDQIVDTVDYKAVSDLIIRQAANHQFELIEPLCEQICQAIFEFAPAVSAILLTCHKPNAVNQAKSVGIKIKRYPLSQG